MKKLIPVLFLVLYLLTVTVYAQSWTGSDDQAEEAIKQIDPSYKQWFSPIWEPPSGEIESFLFSVQSAIGAFVVGYVVGKSRASGNAPDN